MEAVRYRFHNLAIMYRHHLQNLIYFFFGLLLTGCAKVNDRTFVAEYLPGSEAWVQVNVKKLEDTLQLNARAFTMLPGKMVWAKEKVKTVEPGTYFLQLSVDRPLASELAVNDTLFRCFLLPNDTTELDLSFKDGKPILQFKGHIATVNNFYQSKAKHFGYTNSNNQLNTYRTGKVDMHRFKEQVLALQANELHFLQQYRKDHPLPDWFEAIERSNIIYLCSSWLLMLPEYNSSFNLPSTPLPADYYNFLAHVKVSNDEAIFSASYFQFLSYYCMHGEDERRFENSSGYLRKNLLNAVILPKVEKELSGKAREIYRHYRLSGLVEDLPSSYSLDSLLAAYRIEKPSMLDYEKLLYGGKDTGNSLTGKKLQKGEEVPNFFAVDTTGNLYNLRQFKEKVVYLNFYATWCAPCIKSNPAKNQLYQRMKDEKDFIMINICMNSEEEHWKEQIKKHKMQGFNVFADGNWNEKLEVAYGIQGVPQYVLLDRGNVLVENHTHGAEKIESLVRETL